MESNFIARAFNRSRMALWMGRARRLLSRGRFSDATLWCEMTLEVDRTFTPARELLDRVREEALKGAAEAKPASAVDEELDGAFWAIEAERPREAGEHLRRALRQFVRENGTAEPPPELMLARGEVSYVNGWYERAEKELTAARMPGFAGYETTYYLGLCALALGKTGDSQRYFGELVEKHPLLATDRLYDLLEKRK